MLSSGAPGPFAQSWFSRWLPGNCRGVGHQEMRHQLIRLFRLFQLVPCHLDASKVSKYGPGLYNVNK